MTISSTRQRGFTLIELIVTVAILAIVGAIALPQYQRMSLKGKRADAIVFLMDASAKQERFFIDNNEYANSMALLGYAVPTKSEKEFYAITLTNTAATTPFNDFTLTATPLLGQLEDACATFTLDSTNTRAFTRKDPLDTTTKCW